MTGGFGHPEGEPASRSSLVDGAEVAVRRWLAPERFRAGDRLPPEQELARMLGVSRGTLRSALRRLEESGEIVRRQGSGTFVGQVGGEAGGLHTMHTGSYRASASGRKLEVADVLIERLPATRESAAALALTPGRPLTTITRTVLVAAKVAALAHDIIHPEVELPPDPKVRELLHGGRTMFELLSEGSAPPTGSRTVISPLLLTPSDALGQKLRVCRPTACVLLEEVLVGEHDRPLFYSWDVVLPGALQIEVVRAMGNVRPDPVVITPRR